MIKKILFLILIFLSISLTFISAEESFMFKKGENFNLEIAMGDADLSPCLTCTCTVSLFYPNGSTWIKNVAGTTSGDGYCIYFNSTNVLGTYGGEVIFTNGVDYGRSTFEFEITYLGKQLDEAKSILYVGFLGLLILIFFLNFYGMGFLPARNTRDEEGKIMSISYLKYFRNVLWMTGYFLFIGIIYIASNLAFAFLGEELLAKTLFMIFQVSFGIAPIVVIVWIIWIFASMFHDKQFQNMLNRGIFPQGKL